MSKPVILTGLRANNNLTIGNYLGALLPMVDMAKARAGEYQVNLFVPDLHSFTTPIDHAQLYEQTINNVKTYIAAGLPIDHGDVHVYRQSYISAHSELTWILDCFTGMGEMGRMTQFKDKSKTARIEAQEREIIQILFEEVQLKVKQDGNSGFVPYEEMMTTNPALAAKVMASFASLAGLKEQKEQLTSEVSVGLFNYPVLMAADILLYGAAYVPVGEDQTQHLEFARDIALRMNSRFGELFTVPLPVPKQHEFFGKDQGLRIRDLMDPTKKMSKSDDTGKGVVFLSDSPETAAKKIMSATTDSYGEIKYDMRERPGITSLLQMLALLTGKPQQEVNTDWEGKTSYGEFKKVVADAVQQFLLDFQMRLAQVDEKSVLDCLEKGEAAMREQASQTLLRAQQAVGLRTRR